MGEKSRKLDMEELMAYSNNLIEFMKDDKDITGLKQVLRQSQALQYQCDKDFNQVHKSIEDYKEKIHVNKQKAYAAEAESAADMELDLLQKELEEQQQLERMLREELRLTVSEIDGLEHRQVSVEEQRQTIKKLEQDELKAQMKLSMYASVSNIIPHLDDLSKVSGHIVERDKKIVEKFEFDPAKLNTFETCDAIWRMTSL